MIIGHPNDPVMDLAEKITASYGGHPVRRGRDILVGCVIHENDGGHHNPSLALWQRSDGSVGIFCQSMNCPYQAIVAELRRRGIVIGKPSNELAASAAISEEERRQVSLFHARDILLRASCLDDGSEPASRVQHYLKSRGLDLNANERGFLRWAWSDHRREVLLVSPIIDLATLRGNIPNAIGVATLVLSRDGHAALSHDGRKMRAIFGRLRGGGVPIGEVGEHMIAAEGIETCISAMKLLGVPFGVAALSAVNLGRLEFPPGVSRITICIDHDQAGLAGGRALSLRARAVGIRCEIKRPRTPGTDFNDVWVRMKNTSVFDGRVEGSTAA